MLISGGASVPLLHFTEVEYVQDRTSFDGTSSKSAQREQGDYGEMARPGQRARICKAWAAREIQAGSPGSMVEEKYGSQLRARVVESHLGGYS